MNTKTTIDAVRDAALRGDAEAQYQLGRHYAGHQEWARARRYLRDAAAKEHAGALTELALLALHGISVPPDLSEGVALLERAERAGCGEAPYHLALIAWCDNHVRFDADLVCARLLLSGRRDFPLALRTLALLYARDPARASLSDACLARAAARGDAASAFLLGRRERARDPQAAANLLAAALRGGIARAAHASAGLPAATSAVPPDAALPELVAPSLASRTSFEPHRHSDSPLVETYDDVYSAEECEYVIALGDGRLSRSVTIDDNTPVMTTSDYRSSSDHTFYSFQEDFLVRWLQWRMLLPLHVPMANAEHLVLLRYQPGEEYKPHRDYLPPSTPGNSPHPSQPGQRVHTVFCYLADVDAGGETEFPLLNVRISPRTGRVVHFENLHADGSPDARTLHAGLPVREGTKWLATVWTRQRRFRDY